MCLWKRSTGGRSVAEELSEPLDLDAIAEQLVLFEQSQNFEADVENFVYGTVPELIARIRELEAEKFTLMEYARRTGLKDEDFRRNGIAL